MQQHKHVAKLRRPSYHFPNPIVTAVTPTKPVRPLTKIIVRCNVVTPLASLVFGRDHQTAHRLLAGTLVMAIGVIIAKYVGHAPNTIVAHLGDGLGYGLHGIGLIPFIESVASKFE